MKLWSGTLSPFSAKVRVALAEKGLTVEIAEIPWNRQKLWGPKPDAFLAVSPRGEVPVLEDGGIAIFDSTVINEYLEEAYPAVPLLPASPADRAECRMWEELADHFLAVHVTSLIREVFMKPDGQNRDDEVVAEAMRAFSRYLADLEVRLGERSYLSDDYSLADIATWICLTFAQSLGVDTSACPAVQAWQARVSSRPAPAAELALIIGAAAAA
ncbi:MAG: glutathione S-transferase family protein [Gammaproteobacteria bacterium]